MTAPGRPLLATLLAVLLGFALGWVTRVAAASREPGVTVGGVERVQQQSGDLRASEAAPDPAPRMEPPTDDSVDDSGQGPRQADSLLRMVLDRWETPGRLPPGTKVTSLVVNWMRAFPLPDELIEAGRSGVAAEWAAAHGNSDPALGAATSGFDAWARRTKQRAFTYVQMRTVQGLDGWSVRTVGWPTGNTAIRASHMGVFWFQLCGPGGHSHRILVNQEHHAPDEFGTMGTLRLRHELRALGAVTRLLQAEGLAARSAPFSSEQGMVLRVVLPLRTDLVSELPFARHIPSSLVPDRDLSHGRLEVLVLLERDSLPLSVSVFGHSGVLRMRIACAEFHRLSNGVWLPGVVTRRSFLPDGKTPYAGVRCATSISTSGADTSDLLSFQPSAGLQLVAGLDGMTYTRRLPGTTPKAVREEAVRLVQEFLTGPREEAK